MHLTADLLTAVLKKRGMSKAEAARRCEYHSQHMTDLTNGKRALNTRNSDAIKAKLTITNSELMDIVDHWLSEE
jgi:plasmid maintenance system antidote protein VapI